MSVKAYVLVNVELGGYRKVADALLEIEGVQSALEVAGPYDVIAFVEAEDTAALGKLVVSQIQTTKGVTGSLTCIVIQ
jgi:DNA-binding Lrp family transcriptional regulator